MDSIVLGLRVLVSLAAVLGLIWVLQRRLKRRGTGVVAPSVSVLNRQGIGHKASVVLLDADGQRLLLGVTEHGVTVLQSRTAPDADASAVPVSVATPFDVAVSRAAGSPATTADTGHTAVVSGRASGRHAARDAATPASPLAGSILDLNTWRQARDAARWVATGRRS